MSSLVDKERRSVSASWSSQDNLWTIEAVRTDSGAKIRVAANFLWMCQGYYRHSKGYTPAWEGVESFAGRIVHPQTWPQDLDYKGKHVVVIGSGATAATLIPSARALFAIYYFHLGGLLSGYLDRTQFDRALRTDLGLLLRGLG